jgi:hypothetical protein
MARYFFVMSERAVLNGTDLKFKPLWINALDEMPGLRKLVFLHFGQQLAKKGQRLKVKRRMAS